MKYSAALVAAVAALGAQAQNDPNKPETYDPLIPFDKTPSWPTNFGGKATAYGPKPAGCAPLEIIVARGTSEPGTFGAVVGDPVVARVAQRIPGARGYAVQYPADSSATSISTGSSDIVNRLKQQIAACPQEKFVLLGYSQGAAVSHLAANGFDKATIDKVIAAVMFGDPGRILSAKFPGDLQNRVYENCAPGDPICGGGFNANAHLTYNDKGTTYVQNAVDFIVAAWNGTPLPAKPS